MDEDKPVFVVRAALCDLVSFHPSDQGWVNLSFVTDGSHDYVIELSPEGLSSLETKLEKLRVEMAARRSLQ